MADSEYLKEALCDKCKNAPIPPVWKPGKGKCGHEVNPEGIFKLCFLCAHNNKVCARCEVPLNQIGA